MHTEPVYRHMEAQKEGGEGSLQRPGGKQTLGEEQKQTRGRGSRKERAARVRREEEPEE